MPIEPGFWLAVILQTLTLFVLIVGLFGLFPPITLCMLGGNVVDNIIIAQHVREKQVPWSSILLGFGAGILASIFFTPLIGLVASPLGLFGAEFWRLHDRKAA